SEPERQETLAHLAGCARCREIVYLSGAELILPASEVATASLGAELARGGSTSSWFGGMRWLRLVGPAVGLVLIVGVVWHASLKNDQAAKQESPAPAAQSAKVEAPLPPPVPAMPQVRPAEHAKKSVSH